MLLNIFENGLHLDFDVTEGKPLHLLNCSASPCPAIDEKKYGLFAPVSVGITGKNAPDLRGARHSGLESERTLRYLSHTYDHSELCFELTDDEILVRLCYRFLSGVPGVRVTVSVENVSDAPIGLEYLSTFSLTGFLPGGETPLQDRYRVFTPHNAWYREVNWKENSLHELGFDMMNTISTQRVSLSNFGTWSSKEYLPMGALLNNDTGDCMIWQIEHNGSWQWEIADLESMLYLRLSGPNEADHHFYRELAHGERFESVPAAVCFGKGFDGALASLTSYRRSLVHLPTNDAKLPVIFNDYMNCLWGNPTTEKELPMIALAADLGAECYVMDAGWYASGSWWDSIGEWMPAQSRFPGGIREVFDAVRARGMVPGIWLEIECMGVHCPILDQFDDTCFFQRHGKRVSVRGRYQLDFRAKKVRDFADGVVDRIVNEYGVGYIKLDYNIDAGIGTDYDADSAGDGLLKANRAYLSWIDGVRARHPELILENCSSGGMRLDYAMLSHLSLQSVTDQHDVLKMVTISSCASTAVLPEQGAIWAYPRLGESLDVTAINMINAMMMRMHLSGQVAELPPEAIALIKEGVNVYKAVRADIPKALPFHPCGLPSYGDKWFCNGFDAGERRYLSVWRLDGADSLDIPLSAQSIEILYPSASKAVLSKTENGFRVTLPEKNSAVFLRLM